MKFSIFDTREAKTYQILCDHPVSPRKQFGDSLIEVGAVLCVGELLRLVGFGVGCREASPDVDSLDLAASGALDGGDKVHADLRNDLWSGHATFFMLLPHLPLRL